MSNHSVIEHRASYHFVKLEEDYLAICSKGESSPHCKALILAILEHWMNTKRDKGEGSYVYLTMPEWIRHMYMLYERNVIENCIKELLKEKLIIRRPIKRHGQKTFEYTLNIDAIHELIKTLPSKEANDTLPNLDNYLTHRERSKAEKKEAREKSRTSNNASEKSQKVREKSRTASEKSPSRYVKNQLNIDSITELPEIECTSAETDKPANPKRDDSFVPSSTPSLSSSVEHLSTPNVHNPTQDVDNKQAVIQADEHPIATPTTPVQAEPVSTSTQANTSSSARVQRNTGPLDPDAPGIQRIDGYWQQKGLTSRLPSAKEHWRTLSKCIHSFEDFESLFKHTAESIKDKQDKHVKPGNMANADNLDGWVQEQKRTSLPSKQATADPSKPFSVSGLQNLTYNPLPEPVLAEPLQGSLMEIPKFSLSALRNKKGSKNV